MRLGKCPRCRKRTVVSATLNLCDVCAYAEAMGADKALVQSELAARAAARARQARQAKEAKRAS